MQQLTSLLGTVDQAMYATSLVAVTRKITKKARGIFRQVSLNAAKVKAIEEVLNEEQLQACQQALSEKTIVYRENYLFAYCCSECNHNSMLFISGIPKHLTDTQRHLIEIFRKMYSWRMKMCSYNLKLKQHNKS